MQIQAAVSGVLTGQGDLHHAGQRAAFAQLEAQAVFIGGKSQGSAEPALGALDAGAIDPQGIILAQHDQAAACGAQGAQDLAGDGGHVALIEGHFLPCGVLDGGNGGIGGDVVLGALTAGIAAAAGGGKLRAHRYWGITACKNDRLG